MKAPDRQHYARGQEEPRSLTFAQGEALRGYGIAFERVRGTGNAERRMNAQDFLRDARRALTPQEVAILDMVAGRGRNIADLVTVTGQPAANLSALLQQAAVKLANHLEMRTD